MIHAGATLLIQRGKEPNAGLWSFPGGGIEPGETGLQAAIRELAEETEITGTAPRYLTTSDVILRDDSGALTHHFVLSVVQCDYLSGTVRAADDAADARWVPLGEVADIPLTDRVEQMIALALRG